MGIRRTVGVGRFDEVAASHQNATALRTAQILAAAEGYQVSAHLYELAQILGGRQLGRGIHNHG